MPPVRLSPFQRVARVNFPAPPADRLALFTIQAGGTVLGFSESTDPFDIPITCGGGSVIDDYIGGIPAPLVRQFTFQTVQIDALDGGLLPDGDWTLPTHPGCGASPAVILTSTTTISNTTLPARASALSPTTFGAAAAGALHEVQDIDETGPYTLPELWFYYGDGSGNVTRVFILVPFTSSPPSTWEGFADGEIATVEIAP